MAKVKYILLDCDNTLCQSERVAFSACAELANELLAKHNIDARYDVDSLLESFVGYNFRKMILALEDRHGFKMSDEELDEWVSRELGKVIEMLSKKCEECPGVTTQLQWAKEQKYPLSVVSTSAKPRVVASLIRTNLMNFFKDEHVYSAATSLNPPSSKPDPAIYLHACKELGVRPADVVTVEDSRSGATAAMRAGIPCIGYVGCYLLEEGKEKMEEMAKVLTEQCKTVVIMRDWSEFPMCLKKVEQNLKI